MRKLVLLLFLVPALAFGQRSYTSEVVITPLIHTATMDSLVLTSGSAVVTTTGTDTIAAVAGDTVFGYGVLFGTTIDSVYPDKDTLSLSAEATADVDPATLNFAIVDTSTYDYGDWVGLPFAIVLPGSGIRRLQGVFITDTTDALDSLDILFFTDIDSAHTMYADNDTADVLGADVGADFGYIKIANVIDLGSTRVGYGNMQWLMLPWNEKIYARIISRTYNGIKFGVQKPLTIRFNFQQQ